MRGGARHPNEQPWGTKEGKRQPWRCSALGKKGPARDELGVGVLPGSFCSCAHEEEKEENGRRLLSCREQAPWTEARLEQARAREKDRASARGCNGGVLGPGRAPREGA
ncbi:hypothetical protein Zm00014a_035295 [Zea mays]|jgi:hypothetical protein|uniref:Uncharacterized protein n=1 Tax=Zea mays TaxID=4577 RepID=A0A3L6FK75_MAIZE|nr:hypothetical protein Zm00014a_035295 [Zea mays]